MSKRVGMLAGEISDVQEVEQELGGWAGIGRDWSGWTSGSGQESDGRMSGDWMRLMKNT